MSTEYIEKMEEIRRKNKAKLLLLATTGLDESKTKRITLDGFSNSYQHVYEELELEHEPSFEDLFDIVGLVDVVGIFENEDIFGNLYFTCNSPRSTLLIFQYLELRIRNNGHLDHSDLLFPED